MIREFEQYHGVVLRDIVVRASGPITISARDEVGRINSFSLNGEVGLHIKHCSNRLAPWAYTFTSENFAEIEWLAAQVRSLWIALVCGWNGVVSLSLDEFLALTNSDDGRTRFIRIDRDRRTMYRVFGNAGKLKSAKPRGVAAILADVGMSGEAI
jgi:hypothetical protein